MMSRIVHHTGFLHPQYINSSRSVSWRDIRGWDEMNYHDMYHEMKARAEAAEESLDKLQAYVDKKGTVTRVEYDRLFDLYVQMGGERDATLQRLIESEAAQLPAALEADMLREEVAELRAQLDAQGWRGMEDAPAQDGIDYEVIVKAAWDGHHYQPAPGEYRGAFVAHNGAVLRDEHITGWRPAPKGDE
jgi:hypothetical protein